MEPSIIPELLINLSEITCTAERGGEVLLVVINRPKRLNALSNKVSQQLDLVWTVFEQTASFRVAILTGAGVRAFSAGFDLQDANGMDKDGLLVGPETGLGGLVNRRTCFKPIIAAVQGICYGGGFELALACDIIIASENALFALPEPRVGLAALGGGLHRLPRLIGYHQAMGMILTGEAVTALDGYRMGFINQVVLANQSAVAASLEWADRILLCSPDSIECSKQTVLQGFQEKDAIEATISQTQYPKVQAMLSGQNLKEGISAFVSKRSPQWVLPETAKSRL